MTSVSNPSLLQRCPTPACYAVMAKANDYVHAKLAGRLAADYTPLFTSAAYQALRTQLAETLVHGDLEATKAHAKAWCRLLLRYTEQAAAPQPTTGRAHHVAA